jgi:hypothetical protein
MTAQPTPTVTNADVERIVRREFPADQIAEVLTTLNEYGRESWHREPERVRAAALKLARRTLEGLRDTMETAKCDYRDMLAAAEYPGYFRRVPESGGGSAG